MDPLEMARRVLGMAADEPLTEDIEDLAAAEPRPCVECGALTDIIVFDTETMEPVPPLCSSCEEALLDVAWEVVGHDQPPS